jgi:alkylhydroperoxidase family enzyme
VDRALVEYCTALTVDPGSVGPQQRETLTRVGLGDDDVLEVVLLCGYRHFSSRVADGLGLDLEEHLRREDEIVRAFTYAPGGEPRIRPARSGARSEAGGPDPAPRVADGSPLAALTERWRKARGAVPNLIRGLAGRPGTAAAIGQLWECLLASLKEAPEKEEPGKEEPGSEGSGALRQAIETASSLVGTAYFLPWFRDPRETGELRRNESRDAIATLAETLTLDQASFGRQHVEVLRGRGLPEARILDVIVGVAFVNFLGRVVLALGIPADEVP